MWRSHIRVSMKIRAAALIRNEDALLLVQHVKGERIYWLLPGGGVMAGEKLKDALRRELMEELHISCEIGDMVFVVESMNERGDHVIQPTFLTRLDITGEIKLGKDDRVAGYRFFGISELGSLTIYPDIKKELGDFLLSSRMPERYLYRSWIE